MRWLWLAYERGMWHDHLHDKLSAIAFEEWMLDLLASATNVDRTMSYDWVVEARGEDGMCPVGLILGKEVGTGIEPFVEWFPWATPRNQLEATAVFLKEVSKQFKIFVFAPEDANRFWTRFIQYGMIRRGCRVIDYFSRGEHAILFYTVFK